MKGPFLRREVILNDMGRFAADISKRYSIKAEVFQEETANLVYLGYQFEYSGQDIKFFMPYEKRGDELAQNALGWTVKRNDGFYSSFRTIGAVMDFLRIGDEVDTRGAGDLFDEASRTIRETYHPAKMKKTKENIDRHAAMTKAQIEAMIKESDGKATTIFAGETYELVGYEVIPRYDMGDIKIKAEWKGIGSVKKEEVQR